MFGEGILCDGRFIPNPKNGHTLDNYETSFNPYEQELFQKLKERDTPKPLVDFEMEDGYMSGYCSSCGIEHEGEVGLLNFEFCPYCGQKILWGYGDVD